MGKREETVYQKTIKRHGSEMEIYWNVIPSRKFGHPGPFDKDIFRELEQMIDETGYPITNPIEFTTYELCKRMKLGLGGRQYDVIRRALKRIATTSINSKGTFYLKGKKRWVDKVFHLYDQVIFKGEELPDGGVAETNHLYLSDIYLDSLNAQYVKPLNYTYWKALKKPLSKRMYELFGVKFYGALSNGSPFIRYHYDTLCQLLPMKPRKYVSQAKQRLEPGHKELISTGFLKQAEWDEWLIYYMPGPRALEEIEKYASDNTEKEKDRIKKNSVESDEEWIEEWKAKTPEEKAEEMLDRWLMMREVLRSRNKPTQEEIKAKREELIKQYQTDTS